MFKVFVHDLKETELLFFIVADNVKKKNRDVERLGEPHIIQ